MPTLTYTTDNTPHGGTFRSRVLIGRKLSHGVVVNDPAVSRLHAWIDAAADENTDWVITDAGGKVGTYVNDQRITRQPLHDGDVIRVGSVQVLYRDLETLSPGVKFVELTPPTGTVQTAGILFNCHCGAPLWVGSDLAGKRGMCRHCGTPVTVPDLSPTPKTAPPPPVVAIPSRSVSTGKRTAKCGVCHAAITDSEESIKCSDCAVSFHTECWQENFGCSSYGCPQVNALKPAPRIDLSAFEPLTSDEPSMLPWGLILLAASVVGSILGSLLFGGLAAIVAVISVVMLVRGKYQRRGLLIAAIILSIIGIVVGLAVSDVTYFDGQHLPAILIHHI